LQRVFLIELNSKKKSGCEIAPARNIDLIL